LEHAEEFNAEVDATNTAVINGRLAHSEALPQHKRQKKVSILSNQAKIWVPFNKIAVLGGVRIGDTLIKEEPKLTLELGKAWQPTFNLKIFDIVMAQGFLDRLGDFGRFSNVPPLIYSISSVVFLALSTPCLAPMACHMLYIGH